MPTRRAAAFRIPLVGIFLAGLVACDESTAPRALQPASVTIEAGDSVVALSTPLELDARVRDADGRIVDDVAIEWSSSDAAVASVEDGVVSGTAIGYADIVARAGEFADTLRVRVRDDAVPPMRVRVRFGSDAAAPTTELGGFMRFYDTMAGGPGDEAGLRMDGAHVGRDTVLTVLFRGDDHDGRQSVRAFPLDGADAAGVIVLLRLGSAAAGDLEYWASVDAGWVELDVDSAPAPGWRVGSARGFLDVPLVRVTPGSPPSLSADTLRVHANLEVDYQHTLRGWAVSAIVEGPIVGNSVLADAWGSPDGHGGWFLSWDLDLDGLGSGPGRWELNQEVRVLGPAVGTFDVPRFTGDQFGEPDLWPARFSSLFFRDDPRPALVVEGMLIIDRWIPPTPEDYGQAVGLIDGRFEMWTPDLSAPTGDTVRAITEFAVPLPPGAGLPPAPPAPGTRLRF